MPNRRRVGLRQREEKRAAGAALGGAVEPSCGLREGRKRLGWSQQKAARTLGVSQSYLSMLEMGERAMPDDLARKFVRVYRLPPTSLPPTEDHWTPRRVDPQELAEELAGLGYPRLAYLRKRHRAKNPAELLLDALAQDGLEARLFEALPWLLLNYWTMDTKWLVEQAKRHDLQNRLGFVVTLARSVAGRTTHSDAGRTALQSLESSLKRSLLAREESLGNADLSETDQSWLRNHRSQRGKAVESADQRVARGATVCRLNWNRHALSVSKSEYPD